MNLHDLAQIVFSYLERNQVNTLAYQIRKLANMLRFADAERNLILFLKREIRPEIVDKVNIKNILNYIKNKIPAKLDKDIVLDDFVNSFLEYKSEAENQAVEIASTLRDVAMNHVSDELAKKYVETRKTLTDEEKRQIKDKNLKEQLVKVLSKHLLTVLTRQYTALVKKHEKEPVERITEKTPEPATGPILEDIEKARKKYDLETVYDFIENQVMKGKIPENKEEAYKLIINDIWIEGKPIKFVADKLGKPIQTIHDWTKDLGRMLTKWFIDIGIGPKFVSKPGEMKKLYVKDIKIPDYKEHLKEGDNAEDFKDFAEKKFKKHMTPKTKEMLDLMIKGYKWQDLPEKIDGIKRSDADNFYNRKFKKWYKEWYENNLKRLKSACDYIKRTLNIIKKAQISEKHENIVDEVINNNLLSAIIHFNAEFDNEDEESQIFIPSNINYEKTALSDEAVTKLKEIKPKNLFQASKYINETDKYILKRYLADFKYKQYEVTFRSKAEKKKLRSMSYEYKQDLTYDGKPVRTFVSKLFFDGTPGHDDLRKRLDKYVQENMITEGVLPYGQSVVKVTKTPEFKVYYENDDLGRDYDGVYAFVRAYNGLLIKDKPHEERGRIVEKRREKRRTRTEQFYIDIKTRLKRLLRKLKTETDLEEKKKLKELINYIKKTYGTTDEDFERVKQERLEEVERIIAEESLEINQKLKELKEKRKQIKEEARKKREEKLRKEAETIAERKKFLKKLEDLRNEQDKLKSRLFRGIPGTQRTRRPLTPEERKDIEKKISEKRKEIDEIEKKLKEPSKEALFPEPVTADANKFFALLSKYDVKDRKLYGFLTGPELIKVFKILRASLMEDAQKDIKGVKKNKNMSEEDKKDEIEKINRRTGSVLREAYELAKALPDDLEKRLRKLEEKNPEYFKRLEKKHGAQFYWWRNPTKTLRKISDIALEIKPHETPKEKQKGGKPIEEREYEVTVNQLSNTIGGLKTLAQRLVDAPYEAKQIDPKLRESLEKSLTDAKEGAKKIRKVLMEETEKLQQEIAMPVGGKKLREIQDKLTRIYIPEIRSIQDYFTQSQKSPSLTAAYALKDAISDFMKLYSYIAHSIFGEKVQMEIQSAEEALKIDEDEKKKLDDIKEEILEKIRAAAGHSVRHDFKEIKRYLDSARILLRKFIKEMALNQKQASFPYMIAMITNEQLNRPKKVLKSSFSIISEKESEKETEKKEYLEKKKELIFPVSKLRDAKKVINTLKENKMETEADKAQKELNDIIKNVISTYNEFKEKDINALAEKENISYTRAVIRLKRIKDALASEALSEFTMKWNEIAKGIKKFREEKPATKKFEKMTAIVKKFIPDIFEMKSPEKLPEMPELTVPTPVKIRETIEKQFTEIKPQFKEEKIDFYESGGEESRFSPQKGKGGPRTKTRAKPIKKHPPSYTYEKYKKDLINDLKNKGALKIVLDLIGNYLSDLKDDVELENIYYDPNKVVDQVVDILTHFSNFFSFISVGSPLYKPARPPDIVIKNLKEAENLKEKIDDIWDIINIYINPLHVGTPEQALHNKKRLKTFYPIGLLETIEEYKTKQEKTRTAFMAYRIAGIFSGINFQEIEDMTLIS